MRRHTLLFCTCLLLFCTACSCKEHTFSDWVTSAPASCLAAGLQSRTCQKCDTIETQPLPAIGHEWSAWETTQAPSCTKPGVQQRHCLSCSAAEDESISIVPHSYLPATCTAAKICKDCGFSEGAALGHAFTAWETIRLSDCIHAGSQTRSCSACGLTETNPLAALGHQWLPATCSTPKTCSVCQVTDGDKLSHINDGSDVCSLCGTRLARYIPSASEIYAACSPAVFYIETFDHNGNRLGTGSGFFIDSKGIAVTNYHVIEGAFTAKITTANDQVIHAVTGVYDHSLAEDWAVLQVEEGTYPCLKLGDSSKVSGGDTVYTLGSPLGLQSSISSGIVSNPSRTANDRTYIQTSAPISSGSSGGALLNIYGDVIGITAATYVNGQNLNLAVPINLVQGFNTRATRMEGYSNVNWYMSVFKDSGSEIPPLYELLAWIQQNANSRFNFQPAFSFQTTGPNYTNYFSMICDDGRLIFLLRQKANSCTHYLHLIISGSYNEGQDAVLYSFADSPRFDNYNFSGYAKITPMAASADTKLEFYNYSGPADSQITYEYTATTMLSDMLRVLDRVFQNPSPNTRTPFPNIRIADLGYTRYY